RLTFAVTSPMLRARVGLRYLEHDLPVRAALLVRVEGPPHLPERHHPGDVWPDHLPLEEPRDLLQVLRVVPHPELDAADSGLPGGGMIDLADQVDQNPAPLED